MVGYGGKRRFGVRLLALQRVGRGVWLEWRGGVMAGYHSVSC